MIGSSLGDLCDLSAAGARLVGKGRNPPRAGDTLQLRVDGLDGPIDVGARVVWSKRSGWFEFELGLEFVRLDGSAKAALAVLARTAPLNQTFALEEQPRSSVAGSGPDPVRLNSTRSKGG